MLRLIQNRLLYHPDPAPPTAANLRPALGPPLAGWLPDAGASFHGYVRAAPLAGAGRRGTAVVFHGNAGTARGRGYFLHALEPRGVRVILAEYPGYGGRPGRPSQAHLAADGRVALRAAHAAHGEPLWLWGKSLGAAVAAQVAADPGVPLAGVVLIMPWDNLPDLAQWLYPYLPRRLVRDRYDSRAALRAFAGPTAVLIADRDEIVPPAHSQRLYAALDTPKRCWRFPDARHNAWPAHASAGWWDEVLEWLESAGRS